MPICRVCGASAALEATEYRSHEHVLVRCIHCGTLLTLEKAAAESLAETYSALFRSEQNYAPYRHDYECLRQGTLPRDLTRMYYLRKIEYMVRDRDLVEIGGGTGSFGFLCRSRGWNYTDYDISPDTVEQCRAIGLNARLFRVHEIPPLAPASCDAVVMWEVLEHVHEADALLTAILRALRPGGVFLCSVPNCSPKHLETLASWQLVEIPPIHVNFFTRASLYAVLATHGFVAVHVRHRRLRLPSCNWRSVKRSVRLLLGLDEAMTLIAWGRKPKTA